MKYALKYADKRPTNRARPVKYTPTLPKRSRPMPVILLTDKFIQGARPKAGARQTDYFDEVTKGLSLSASIGGAKVFFLHYTHPMTGKRARHKLGAYGDISLAKAREKAREGRATVTEGRAPADDRRADAAALRVKDLVESYITRHAAAHRSGDEIARRLRKNVSDVIGAVKLSQLHRRDLTRCIDAVKDRGAPVEANRVFEDMRAMVRWARARGDLDENLAEGMRRPSESVERDRVLLPDEIKTFWDRLADAEMEAGTERVLKLILATLARPGEVASMSTAQLQLDRRIWTSPPEISKNKREHVLPLSDLAVELIEEQLGDIREAAAKRRERLERRLAHVVGGEPLDVSTDGPEWVFPGPGARAPITEFALPKAVKRNQAHFGLKSFTPHDLRRTASTRCEEIGISPFIVAHLLGHVSVTKASITSKVYAHYDYAREKREAIDKWGAHLSGILEGAAAVVPMQRR